MANATLPLAEFKELLSRMSETEKSEALQILEHELHLDTSQKNYEIAPGIESVPGVCGGDPVIAKTRIPVWTLVQARRLGISEGDLLLDFPSLRTEDLVNAWAYYEANREEIEQQINDNENA